jgi:hypothetical protein
MKTKSSRNTALVMAALFLCMAVQLAAVAAQLFEVTFSGLAEVPSNFSPGTGTGTITLNNDNTLTCSITFSGLTAPATAAHIYGPAGPGTNAAVLFPLTVPAATSGAITDTTAALSGVQIGYLTAGLLYVSIHTTAFPGGEIRAQLVSVGSVPDQYAIDWFTVDGGGGTCTGGIYTITSTIGQPDASGQMTGDDYSLTGGFWSLISVVQTAGAPTLYISHTGNTVMIYWQSLSGWNLQQNGNLAAPGDWTTSGYTINTSNGTNTVTIISPSGNLFFRLHQ